jgi:hypothetical protein
MSNSILTLLIRNLDVVCENDPAHRRAAVDEIFHEGAVSLLPRRVHCGRDEIHRIAGATGPALRCLSDKGRRNPN